MALTLRIVLSTLLVISFAAIATSESCLYLVRVQTGFGDGSGTDAKVKLQVFDHSGKNFVIDSLENFGIMEPGHLYFERSNLDLFSFSNVCLNPCKIYLETNGWGNRPDWNLEYVEITTKGPGIATQVGFPVSYWLGLGYPFTVNLCLPARRHN
ncbi:PLAT domain-containing protein 3-like [Prosopis cineraria]|uniref:PLAT domain-containing protein 3-like n=1 Tax=Prosopis cineraria TaxID=364024 RepID=UPI00240FCDB8|nr:PLAT domain-containing protein 3-like [Prosopis cineraria]